MIRREMYDVELPSSTNEDGSFDLFGFNQRIMIELAVSLGEVIDSVSLWLHYLTVFGSILTRVLVLQRFLSSL
jgi:hypothetical protein